MLDHVAVVGASLAGLRFVEALRREGFEGRITVVGAVSLAGTGQQDLANWLGAAAVALASINVVGGYMVTDRMLAMFKKKED